MLNASHANVIRLIDVRASTPGAEYDQNDLPTLVFHSVHLVQLENRQKWRQEPASRKLVPARIIQQTLHQSDD